MAWRRPGGKPLSEPMRVILTTHICVLRPKWVKAVRAANQQQSYKCTNSCHGTDVVNSLADWYPATDVQRNPFYFLDEAGCRICNWIMWRWTLWTLALLTHCDRMTLICVSKLAIIGSGNGLSPRRRQAINWTNSGISLIGSLGTNFSKILIGHQRLNPKMITHKKLISFKHFMFFAARNWRL